MSISAMKYICQIIIGSFFVVACLLFITELFRILFPSARLVQMKHSVRELFDGCKLNHFL